MSGWWLPVTLRPLARPLPAAAGPAVDHAALLIAAFDGSPGEPGYTAQPCAGGWNRGPAHRAELTAHETSGALLLHTRGGAVARGARRGTVGEEGTRLRNFHASWLLAATGGLISEGIQERQNAYDIRRELQFPRHEPARVAERLQVSRQAVSRWNGTEQPWRDQQAAACGYFGVTTDDPAPPPAGGSWRHRDAPRKWKYFWPLASGSGTCGTGCASPGAYWIPGAAGAVLSRAYGGLGGLRWSGSLDMAEMGGVNLLDVFPAGCCSRPDAARRFRGGAGAVFRNTCTKEAGGGNAVNSWASS